VVKRVPVSKQHNSLLQDNKKIQNGKLKNLKNAGKSTHVILSVSLNTGKQNGHNM